MTDSAADIIVVEEVVVADQVTVVDGDVVEVVESTTADGVECSAQEPDIVVVDVDASDLTSGDDDIDIIDVVDEVISDVIEVGGLTFVPAVLRDLLYRSLVLADVTVASGRNWKVLDVSGGESPPGKAAVGATNTAGVVVAQHGGSFGSDHSLEEVSGPNAIQPSNAILLRSAVTQQPLKSGGKDIWALLQSESSVNGHAFDDSTNRVQLSFVIENDAGDDLIACPFGDIAGQEINYSYVLRGGLDAIPETAFIENVFVDSLEGAGGGSSFTATAETDVLTTIGMPLHVKVNTHVAAARTDSLVTRQVVGLASEVKSPGFAVKFLTQGIISQADWTSVIGVVSLSPGLPYFASAAEAGKLTLTPPSGPGVSTVEVGIALSTVALDINISPPILRG